MATQLREAPAVTPVPAIGYSIVANVGGERQFTAQCFVEQDESDAEINAKVDRIMKVIDRQRAIYGLEELESQLTREKLTLFNGDQKISEEEARYTKSVEALNERRAELVEQRTAINDAAYEKGRSSPVGAEGGRYNAMGKELGEIDKQLKELEQGRKDALQMMAPGREKQLEITAEVEAKIAKAKALIDGG